jgi:type IV pilus assembly protein PilA
MIWARRLLPLLVLLVVDLMFAKRAGERTRFRQDMNAVKAILTIHTAETQYYSQYGQYATSIGQLGAAELIGRDLAIGEKGGFRFALQATATGYALIAVPIRFGASGTNTYFSDQSMSIHEHNGREAATLADPLIGETVREQQQAGPARQP